MYNGKCLNIKLKYNKFWYENGISNKHEEIILSLLLNNFCSLLIFF